MKEKYIKFFKKEIVVLLILLIVICFSFGVTYSNFIYNSNSKRAVEMFTSKLSYEVKIDDTISKEVTIKPGINVFNVSIKSLNGIKSYFKVSYKSNSTEVFVNGNEIRNSIEPDESILFRLVAINNSPNNQLLSFDVTGGFTNNKVSDVKVKDDYIELEKIINIGDSIELNNYSFRLLEINNDGSIDLVSKNLNEKIQLNSPRDYNNSVTLMNNRIKGIFNYNNVVYARSVNIDDINKYTLEDVLKYSTGGKYCSNNGFVHYPKLFEYEIGTVINYTPKNGNVNPSDEYFVDDIDYGEADCVSTKKANIKTIEYTDEVYNEIFGESSSYFLGTRYNNYNDIVEWGLISINNSNIELNKIYDSKGNNYVEEKSIKAIIRLNNNTVLEYNSENNIFKVK